MAFLTELLLGIEPRPWITFILPTAFVSYYLLWIVYTRTLHPLAKIPGPFWPAVSRTWLMYRAYAGDLEIAQRALHEKYGPLVRVAPDEVVCSDPREMPTVYPTSNPYEKTVWYNAWRRIGTGASRPDLFTNTSEKDHTAYRRLIGHVYSLSSILKSEPRIDEMVNLFIERLGQFADKEESFDFGLWLEMYAYDNIGVAYFGEQFGFLKDSIDYGGYIRAVHDSMPFFHFLASAPQFMRPLIMIGALAIPNLLKALLAANEVEKTAKRETYKAKARAEEETAKRIDVTSQLLNIARHKGKENNWGVLEVVSENWTAVMAGADSTSIALRSVFYFMMKNPETLAKARAEVDAAFLEGRLTSPVQHHQAIKLPYLMAVIKESFRIYSPFAIPSQRYAPAQGIVLCGTHIPGGWRVGLNPAVTHHNKEVFGEDVKSFRPERWLEKTEQTKLMEKCMMHFGAGSRKCTGQNLAMTEIYKIVPEILHRFTFELTHDGPWTTYNAAFNIQSGVICHFKRRPSL